MIPIFNISRSLWKDKPAQWGNVSDVQSGLFHNAERIGIDPESIALAMPMWEKAGLIAHDYSGNNNYGTFGVNMTWVNAGVKASSFAVITHRMQINASTELLNLPTTHNFTAICKVAAPSYIVNGVCLSWGGTDDLLLYPYSTTNGNGARMFWRDVGGAIIDQNDSMLLSTDLNTIAFVSRASNSHELYMEGRSVGSSSGTGTAGPFSTLSICGWSDSQQQFQDGTIAHTLIFGSALKDSQVALLSDNPYQLWQPRVPTFYSFEAATSGTGVAITADQLSVASSMSATASAAAPIEITASAFSAESSLSATQATSANIDITASTLSASSTLSAEVFVSDRINISADTFALAGELSGTVWTSDAIDISADALPINSSLSGTVWLSGGDVTVSASSMDVVSSLSATVFAEAPVEVTADSFSLTASISGSVTVADPVNISADALAVISSLSGDVFTSDSIAIVATPLTATITLDGAQATESEVAISVDAFSISSELSGSVAIISEVTSSSLGIRTGGQISVYRTDTATPLSLAVDNMGGVAGLTVVASVRDGGTYLDFSDNTFKSSGWGQKTTALSDLGAGFYTGALDVNSITNIPNTTNNLVIEYTVSGSYSAVALGVVSFYQSVPSASENATAVWSATPATELLDDISFLSQTLKNKREIKKIGNVWTLFVYADDGVTPILSKPLKDVGGDDISDIAAGILSTEIASSV